LIFSNTHLQKSETSRLTHKLSQLWWRRNNALTCEQEEGQDYTLPHIISRSFQTHPTLNYPKVGKKQKVRVGLCVVIAAVFDSGRCVLHFLVQRGMNV